MEGLSEVSSLCEGYRKPYPTPHSQDRNHDHLITIMSNRLPWGREFASIKGKE